MPTLYAASLGFLRRHPWQLSPLHELQKRTAPC